MKYILGRILGLVVLGAFAIVAGPVQAQTTANGPYYAEPSWDQKLDAATRFIVLLNWNSEAVLDRETGLMWEKSPAATMHTWSLARHECPDRATGGRKGWRLPSGHELASLVDPSIAIPGPTLPPGHPFTNVQTTGYWSATTSAEFPQDAWVVFLGSGAVPVVNKSSNTLHAWCVRGGSPLSEY